MSLPKYCAFAFGSLLFVLIGCGSESSSQETPPVCEGHACAQPEPGKVGGECVDTTCDGLPFDQNCDGCDGENVCSQGTCIAPQRRLGEPCANNAQCSAPYVYCDGTCIAYGKVGARCRPAEDSADDKRCEEGASCNETTALCEKAGLIGQLCFEDGTCSESASECDLGTFRCVRRITDECGGCSLPRVCNPTTKKCGLAPGEKCTDTSECNPNDECRSGPVQIGSDFFTDRRCRIVTRERCNIGIGCVRECLAKCAKCEEVSSSQPSPDAYCAAVN